MFLIELSAQMSVFKIIIQGMIERNPDKRSEIVDVIRTLGEVTQFDIEVSISFIILIIPLTYQAYYNNLKLSDKKC